MSVGRLGVLSASAPPNDFETCDDHRRRLVISAIVIVLYYSNTICISLSLYIYIYIYIERERSIVIVTIIIIIIIIKMFVPAKTALHRAPARAASCIQIRLGQAVPHRHRKPLLLHERSPAVRQPKSAEE